MEQKKKHAESARMENRVDLQNCHHSDHVNTYGAGETVVKDLKLFPLLFQAI